MDTAKESEPPEGMVHVTRRVSTKTVEQLRCLMKPSELYKSEGTAWMLELLREARSDNPDEGLCALYRFQIIWEENTIRDQNQGFSKASECASYLMQKGFLKEVQKGFREALFSGEWLVVPQDDTSFRSAVFLNRVSVYANVLIALTLDRATTLYVLKEIPDLVELLEKAYYMSKDPEAFRLPPGAPDLYEGVRSVVAGALISSLLHSKKTQKKVGRARKFLSYMLTDSMERHTVEAFGDTLRVYALRILLYTVKHCDQPALYDTIVAFCFSFLEKPVDKDLLEDALSILLGLSANQKQDRECPKAVSDCLVALAACDLVEPEKRNVAAALVILHSKKWRDKVTRLLPPRFQASYSLGEISKPACKALTTLSLADEDNSGRLKHFEEYYRQPTQEGKAVLRQCSHSKCEKVEVKEKEFKVCAGCSLALFCSKGK